MKYLFFDIESPNGHPEEMCEFGYVIYDECFNVIVEEVILLNPECKFLPYHRNRRGFDLYFDKSKYFASPNFPFYYSKFKSILTDSDTINFGFSVNNDESYILFNANRYKLASFDFNCYDVQTLYSLLFNKKTELSLNKIAKTLLNEEEISKFKEHYSLDDAKLTARCLMELMKKFNLKMDDVLKTILPISALKNYRRIMNNREKDDKVILSNKNIWDCFVNSIDVNKLSKCKCSLGYNIFKNKSNLLRSIRYIKENKLIPVNTKRVADIIIVSGPKEINIIKSKINFKDKKFIKIEEIKF